MPLITRAAIRRTLLLAQFSPKPWKLASQLTLDEMRSYAASPAFDELLTRLAYGDEQKGAPRGSITTPIVIGWGRHDHVCMPGQSRLAKELFPEAKLHWFDEAGHFPQWDLPHETAELILATHSDFP
jgi:pimeloyl-ACP methyl ester carboxylesterase